jgi:CRP-like cAMP-binding protein
VASAPPSFAGSSAAAIECELFFFVPNIGAASDAQNELFDLVHRHCAAADLRLAPPAGSLFVQPSTMGKQSSRDTPQRLLDSVAGLAPLTDEERASLAGKLRRRSVKPGETLIESGSVPDALYIVNSGVLLATRREGEFDVELFRLGPGDCAGLASILTGCPAPDKISALTKAMVYAAPRVDLAAIFKERPAVATELGQILARREAVGLEKIKKHVELAEHRETPAERLAERMSTLFH